MMQLLQLLPVLLVAACYLPVLRGDTDTSNNTGDAALNMGNVSLPLQPYELPVIPAVLPAAANVPNSSYSKHIPRLIWMAVKDIKDELPSHIHEFFRRNSGWERHICDNKCKDEFMHSVFAETSTQWAYDLIHPALGAAKADIWRLAVLYTYGGMYLDDDSDIKTPLDEVVQAEDYLLMSEEGASSMGDCYNPTYHLSDSYTYMKYFSSSGSSTSSSGSGDSSSSSSSGSPSSSGGSSYTRAPHFHGFDKEKKLPIFFHGNTLVNWGIFVSPRHPVLKLVLENVLEIVTSTYLRESVVHISRWDVKFKQLLCTTNFVMTYTLREVELQGTLPLQYLPRVCQNNFQQYGGNVKAIWTGADPDHYRKSMMRRNGPQLLQQLVPLQMEQVIAFLDGRAVMGDEGRQVFLVINGQKRPFGDYDTFLTMKFTDYNTKHVPDEVLSQIPLGKMIDPKEALVQQFARGNLVGAGMHNTHRYQQQRRKHHPHSVENRVKQSVINPFGAGQAEETTRKRRVRKVVDRFSSHHQTISASSSSSSSGGSGSNSGGGDSSSKILRPSEVLTGSGNSDSNSISNSNSVAVVHSDSTGTGNRTAADSELFDLLQQATARINKKPQLQCFGDDYGGTRDAFIEDEHKDVLGDLPVLAHPLCTGTFQLGNTLGYYLNDIACASLAHAHFVAVHKTFKFVQPELLATQSPADRLTFFNHLPDLIIHPEPLSGDEVKQRLKKECDCLQFCWENSAAPWLRRVPLIGDVLRPAAEAYAEVAGANKQGTLLNPDTDMSTLPLDAPLPLYPNVTIQYRCGDNIGFGKSKYGLLPFSAFTPPRIPADVAQFIYVIADSPARSATHPYSYRCETVLQRLHKYLKNLYPHAVVVVKRGGDLFLDYARIMHSSVVVCSASTFCLWPALSNQHGQVHFPLTPLIAKAETLATAPKLSANFHWISEVEMIKQFKHYRPWDRLIDDLEK